jgi:type II secretion system protein C
MSRKKPAKRPSVNQDPALRERIAGAALEHPDFGVRRLSRLLKKEGTKASESAIRSTLKEQGLYPCKLRLALLEKRYVNEGLQLTGEQRAALENFNPSLREPEPTPPIAAVLPETPEKPEEPEPVPESPVALSPKTEKAAGPGPEPAAPVALPAPTLELRAVKVSAAAPMVRIPARRGWKKAGMGRWILRAFKAAVICIAIYVAAGIAWKIWDYLHAEPEPSTASIAQPSPDARQAQAKVRANPIETYRVIWERNLFRVSEPPKKQKVPETIDVDKIAEAENNLGLKLIGTVLANDPNLNYAFIDVAATRRQGVFREKESAGGVFIKKILRNNVIIETDKGEIKRLSVEDAELRNIGASKPLLQPLAEAKADSDTPREITSRPITVRISRAEVISSLSNVQNARAASSLSPFLLDGKPDGFRIVNPGPKNILTRIGLRPGDLVRGVEGMQLERPEDTVGFFQRLREGGEFSILVQRGGQIQLLQLVIN